MSKIVVKLRLHLNRQSVEDQPNQYIPQ